MRLNVNLLAQDLLHHPVLKFRERVVGECSKEKIATKNLEEKYDKNMFYIRYP